MKKRERIKFAAFGMAAMMIMGSPPWNLYNGVVMQAYASENTTTIAATDTSGTSTDGTDTSGTSTDGTSTEDVAKLYQYINGDKTINKAQARKDYETLQALQDRLKKGEWKEIFIERMDKEVNDTTLSSDKDYFLIYAGDLNLTEETSLKLRQYIYDLSVNHPEYYWISGVGFTDSFKYFYVHADSQYLSNGRVDRKKAIEAYYKLESRISSLMLQINDSMTDIEKVLAVHEWVVRECEYDYKNYCQDTIPSVSYSKEGVIFEGLAVCDGYAKAMYYFLNRIGIDCWRVWSEIINHAWNVVKVDGNYYNLDATWDDMGKDDSYEGAAHRYYFIRSDSEFAGYCCWLGAPEYERNVDNSFEGYIFREDRSQSYNYFDGFWYYKEGANVMKSKIDGTQKTVFKNYNATLVNMFIYKNDMYVATTDKVYKINMNKAEDQTVIFDISKESNFGEQIDEFVIKQDKIKIDSGKNSKIIEIINKAALELNNNNMELSVGNTVQLEASVKSGYPSSIKWVSSNPFVAKVDENGEVVGLSEGTATIVAYADGVMKECAVTVKIPVSLIYGDANNDGTVNSKDVVMMKKHLAGYTVDIDLKVCDVNGDGAVNSKDVVLVMKKLAGYDVVLGK